MYVYKDIAVYVCMHACMYVYTYIAAVCMYACMHAFMYIRI